MCCINEAYDALRDQVRRAATDAELKKRSTDEVTQRLMDLVRRRTESQRAAPAPKPLLSRQPYTWLTTEISKSRPSEEAFWWVLAGALIDAGGL